MYYAEIDLVCNMSAMHPDLIKGEIDDYEKDNSRWVGDDKITYVYNHTRPNGHYGFYVYCTSRAILTDLLLDHHYGSGCSYYDDDDIKWVENQIVQLKPDRIGRDKVQNDIINADDSDLYDEEFSFQDHEDETVGPRTGYEDDIVWP